ncbi:Protein yifE [Escherichia coli ISC41]|nr:Protein yifE [Escherichia coli ISC41]
MAESFTTTNRYFDNKHYPRGFSRHGDFTIKEAQLLERHGYAFNELDLGKTRAGYRGRETLRSSMPWRT